MHLYLPTPVHTQECIWTFPEIDISDHAVSGGLGAALHTAFASRVNGRTTCAAKAACESVALPILPISLSRALSIGRQQEIASICYVHIARSSYLSYSYPRYLFPIESHAFQPQGANVTPFATLLHLPCILPVKQ